MAKSKRWQWIPTSLTLAQFEQFVLPHPLTGRRGPAPKLSLHGIAFGCRPESGQCSHRTGVATHDRGRQMNKGAG